MKNAARVALVLMTALIAGVGCGGNYSNEDIDFQLALPERDDLLVNLPSQALSVADAAEYYRITRDVVVRANLIVVAVTGLVDAVRSFPATTRAGDLRVWGPFPLDQDPAFEVRMTMVRSPDPAGLRFDYQIEFHRIGDVQTAWHALISGIFFPNGGARLNRIVVDLVEARRQNYPVKDFNELEALQIDYQRRVAPYQAKMTVRNVKEATVPGATYAYAENADRSGEMTFVYQVRDNALVTAIELFSRWNPSGAGRGDARVVEGSPLVMGARGIDCWGADTRATYVRRDWAGRPEEGDPATCAFPAPAPQ